jgi:predicted GIY-YIG superfamily endonuclease
MARPRTIEIFLPHGDPRGIRIAALTTSIVQVVEVPNKLLPEFQAMKQAKQVGVYFLIRDEDDGSQPAVYIGQSGELGKRLSQHESEGTLGFWNRALVVVSLTHSFTQTHALYLEWQGILHANNAARYKVANGNAGSKPFTPAPMEADCQEVFETLQTLVATMGQPVFLALAHGKDKAPKDDVFYAKGPNYEAVAEYTDEGLVVLKGSRARVDMANNLQGTGPAKRREGLLADGRLKQEGNAYVFQEDVLFKSPSGASDVVTGTSSNGWTVWKSKTGQTLHDLKRAPLADGPTT